MICNRISYDTVLLTFSIRLFAESRNPDDGATVLELLALPLPSTPTWARTAQLRFPVVCGFTGLALAHDLHAKAQ